MRAIEYVPKIEGTDVVPFLIDAYRDLSKSNHIDRNIIPASGNEQAFYIRSRSKKIVGLLSFFISDDGKSYTINMGYVAKAHRKKGYYSALWNRLVEEAKKSGVEKIIGMHNPENKGILAFNARVGRISKYITSEFTVV